MRAEFENGGVMMFGVRAADDRAARSAAQARLTRLDRTSGVRITRGLPRRA